MRLLVRRLLAACLTFVAPWLAGQPDSAAFTAEELAQGYRDGFALVVPKNDRGAQSLARSGRPLAGVKTVRRYEAVGDIQLVKSTTGESTESLLQRLRTTGEFAIVEPDYIKHLDVLPDDPRSGTGEQWSLKNLGLSGGVTGADIDAENGWELLHDAADVVVAVIDSGVRVTHQDIADNLWTNPGEIPDNKIDDDANGYVDDVHGINATNIIFGTNGNPRDDNGHGTHVAGIIGAIGNNGVGIAGVAWKVQIMALRFTDSSGNGLTSDEIECIDYAIKHGADLINASYGTNNALGFSNAQLEAVRRAEAAGIIFVTAAGNAGVNLDLQERYPASYRVENIVTVGSSTRRDEAAVDSNFGSGTVDLFAPGAEITSLSNESDYDYRLLSGTSMAAPHVTGALALLRAKYPSEHYRSLINRLLRGTSPAVGQPNPLNDVTVTRGRLDLAGALLETSNRPINDDFEEATVLQGPHVNGRFASRYGTRQAGEPLHAARVGGASLWWSWTAPTDSRVVVKTTPSVSTGGSPADTLLAVYTGNTVDALTPVASNDDGPLNRTSELNFLAEKGTTYAIAVDVANGTPALLSLSLGTVQANDSFETPEVLTGTSVRVVANNTNASREPGEPLIQAQAGARSLWYRWTAPATGQFEVSAVSTEVDPLLGVYTGTKIDALEVVATNDNAVRRGPGANTDALVTFNATAGTTYVFALDTKNAGTGEIVLSLTDTLWQFSTANTITSSPSIAPDGTIYVGGSDQRLYALNPDGSLKWSYPVSGLIDLGAPSVADDGTVYIGSNDTRVYAIAPDGTKKWDYDTDGSVVNTVAVAADGTLYVKSYDGFLYALTPAGALKWRRSVAGQTYASPTIAKDGTIYIGGDAGTGLRAYGPDGELKWSRAQDGDVFTSAAIDDDGHVYIATLSGTVRSYTADGTQRWSSTVGSAFSSSPAVVDGRVYLGGYDRGFYALDANTGATVWKYDLPDEVRASSPAVAADGSILIGCYDGYLYQISADGNLVRRYATGAPIRSSPVLANGRLYFGSNDRKLYGHTFATGVAKTGWPQWQQNSRRLGRRADAVVPPTQATAAVAGPVIWSQSFTLNASATGTGLTYQWHRDGAPIAGATQAQYKRLVANATDAGLYHVVVANAAGQVSSEPVVVAPEVPIGLQSRGNARVVGHNIVHSNGNVYDQLLLTGRSASFVADPDQISRLSFIDLSDDIVQVEFSGPGSVTVVLENYTGPNPPAKYTQPDVRYMKGHARIYVTGATERTFLSIFSVGKINAANPDLFPANEEYDGVADVALVALTSADGAVGGFLGGNAGFFATAGHTGLYAPGAAFRGPVRIHDVRAEDTANPVLITGETAAITVAGGDLEQANERDVTLGDAERVMFVAGANSHGVPLPLQPNRSRLMRDGVDVTDSVVH